MLLHFDIERSILGLQVVDNMFEIELTHGRIAITAASLPTFLEKDS